MGPQAAKMLRELLNNLAYRERVVQTAKTSGAQGAAQALKDGVGEQGYTFDDREHQEITDWFGAMQGSAAEGLADQLLIDLHDRMVEHLASAGVWPK